MFIIRYIKTCILRIRNSIEDILNGGQAFGDEYDDLIDLDDGDIDGEPTPPRYPCPKCGKETKEHQISGTRICSCCRQISVHVVVK